MEAEIVDGLCQRYGQPPSVILQEDAQYIYHLMALIKDADKDE